MNNKIQLPITLPMTFGMGILKGITLPITLPLSFTSLTNRTLIKIPSKEEVVYANEAHSFKIPVTEKAYTNSIKIPATEKAWIFEGLVIEENVVAKMNNELMLLEDIKSRILVDLALVNRSELELTWYGDEVPGIDIYKKVSIDDNYEKVGSYEWEDGKTVINLDGNEYNLKLEGANSTGESSIITVGETNYTDLTTSINVSINEKVYSFDINLREKYEINVDF